MVAEKIPYVLIAAALYRPAVGVCKPLGVKGHTVFGKHFGRYRLCFPPFNRVGIFPCPFFLILAPLFLIVMLYAERGEMMLCKTFRNRKAQ